jgi:ADP-heptose:LPS heptosyltransferase
VSGPEVRTIAVLRPNAVGDFMFALPALHALRASYPDAHIIYLGKQWHADFLRKRPGPIDEVLALPPYPGVGGAPDAGLDPEPALRVAHALRDRGIDMAIQMYGGGRYSNPFLKELGASLTVGTATRDAVRLDRTLAYGAHVNRRLELLQVVALVGAQPRLMQRELEATHEDRASAEEVLPATRGECIVVLHPGASDPRRRWPPDRFARVADALARRGAMIVISATAEERHLADAIVASMTRRAVNLAGILSLRALCGLLEQSAMILSNDTGPLHMALSLGKPGVGIFWLTNLIESGPLNQHLLRPALSLRVHCPVCGHDNRTSRCVHDDCFVDDISADTVEQEALELYQSLA